MVDLESDLSEKLYDLTELCPINLKLKIDQVSFETQESITFQILDKLSKFFETEAINLKSEGRSEGYCETCHYSYEVSVITIKDFDLEKLKEKL